MVLGPRGEEERRRGEADAWLAARNVWKRRRLAAAGDQVIVGGSVEVFINQGRPVSVSGSAQWQRSQDGGSKRMKDDRRREKG